MSRLAWTALLITQIAISSFSAELIYKDLLIERLVNQVPGLLEQFDAETGHFGEGIWISTDQNRMYPLAVAYAYKSEKNPYYKDKNLLEVIMKAGDALIEDMDENGCWEFRKKDGSTWGPIRMPWAYSRWIRSYSLIRDDMPDDRREVWMKGLTLGYSGIAEHDLHRVHNIPAHHAMGLYVAGKALEKPEWTTQAADFLMKVVEKQAEGGYWSENVGPVVGYNFVYTDALGTYYALSQDKRVLPALAKASRFHWMFTYPNGDRVETIDERNPYHPGVDVGNVGFTFTPEGRAYLQTQWERYGKDKLSYDLIASLLLYGQEGPVQGPGESGNVLALEEDGKAMAAVVRQSPWFICLSAYTAPLPENRWIQDRQNLVSIFHEKTGLITGGGNTKLQPAWSNFTVGDMNLLKHTPGDTEPDFAPKGELFHIPQTAVLKTEPCAGLELTYGPETCRISAAPQDAKTLVYTLESTLNSELPVAAHITLLPHVGTTLKTGNGQEITLGEEPFTIDADALAGQLEYAGVRFTLPNTASVHWPAMRHNPYRKDGHSTREEDRIEIRLPFSKQNTSHKVMIEIVE